MNIIEIASTDAIDKLRRDRLLFQNCNEHRTWYLWIRFSQPSSLNLHIYDRYNRYIQNFNFLLALQSESCNFCVFIDRSVINHRGIIKCIFPGCYHTAHGHTFNLSSTYTIIQKLKITIRRECLPSTGLFFFSCK